MTIAILLSAAAAVLYAIANHADKFLLSKMLKNSDYRALVLISTGMAGAIMSVIYAFLCNFSLDFDWQSILILLANSAIMTTGLIFYFKAMRRDDPTIVIIMYQLIPVFILFLSPIFLSGQGISLVQLIGGIIVTLAAIIVTYEPKKKKFDHRKLVTLFLMAGSSVAYALWFILERYVNATHDFNRTTFWSNLTLCVVGLMVFIVFKTYRKSFRKMLKTNGAKVIGISFFNEIIGSFAGIISTVAGTMASVALVSFTSQGVQPFAVMIIGIFLAKFWPKTFKEHSTKKAVALRVAMIILCIIGLACIEFG